MKNIKNVGVIGSGLMGTEIAMVFAQHQYKVVLIDNSPVALEQSKKKIDLIDNTMIASGLHHNGYIKDIFKKMENKNQFIEQIYRSFLKNGCRISFRSMGNSSG